MTEPKPFQSAPPKFQRVEFAPFKGATPNCESARCLLCRTKRPAAMRFIMEDIGHVGICLQHVREFVGRVDDLAAAIRAKVLALREPKPKPVRLPPPKVREARKRARMIFKSPGRN